jgi:hypothetical protein
MPYNTSTEAELLYSLIVKPSLRTIDTKGQRSNPKLQQNMLIGFEIWMAVFVCCFKLTYSTLI